MEWINTPTASNDKDVPFRRCRLHRDIRNHKWETVKKTIELDPTTVREYNRFGWSSLLLAIYHQAPEWVIQIMLTQESDNTDLLSTQLPNGSRLCLHFAARYSDNLEVFKLLVEGFPSATLIPSTDGSLPVERARFYQKDPSIVNYLQKEMTAEQTRRDLQRYNRKLQFTVLLCLEHASVGSELVQKVYEYAKEREMPSLIQQIVGYVGVRALPRSA